MIDDRIISYIEKRLGELGNRFKGSTISTDQFLRLERAVDDFRIMYAACAKPQHAQPRKPKPKDPNDPFDRAMRGI